MVKVGLLNRRAHWLFIDGWAGWTSGALLVASVVVLVLTHPRQEVCIRWWGMFLQFVGIAAVVHDLWSTQEYFRRPNLLQRLRQWLGRWPRGNVTLTARGQSMSVAGGTARPTQRAPIDPSAPIDSRVANLEQNFLLVDRDLGKVEHAAAREQIEREKADKGEALARQEADEDIERHLAEVSTGTVPVSLFGIAWLAAGVFLSTGSAEIAEWMKWLVR